jgi:ABC-type multidrug transport system ATPase subunit
MTTHSMEEAEALSDCVAIISAGSMKCFGTPVHLKSKFGGSIVLNVLCEKGHSNEALRFEALTLAIFNQFMAAS